MKIYIGVLLFCLLPFSVFAQDDLSIAMMSGNLFTDVTPADTVSYIIYYTWTSSAGNEASDVVVTDNLPSEIDLISVYPEANSNTGNTLTWNLGNLKNNHYGMIVVTGIVKQSVQLGSKFSSTASITGNVNDSNPENNTSTVELNVTTPAPDLWVWQFASFEDFDFFSYNTEQNIPTTFNLYYFNLSQHAATNVVLYDSLPAGTEFVSANPEPTSVAGNVIKWEFSTLDEFAFGEISLTVRPTAIGTFECAANITSLEEDRTPSNNRSVVTYNVKAVLQPKLLKPAVEYADNENPLMVGSTSKLEGLAKAGATVKLYDGNEYGCFTDLVSCGATEIGSAVVGPDRRWTISLENLQASKTYYLYLQAEFNGEKSSPAFNFWQPIPLKVDTMFDAIGFDFDHFTVASGGSTVVPGALGGRSGTTPDADIRINKRQKAPADFLSHPEYLSNHDMKLVITENGETYEETWPVSEVVKVQNAAKDNAVEPDAYDYIYVHKGFGPGSTIEVWCKPVYYGPDGLVLVGLVWTKCHEILIDPAGYVYDPDIAGSEYEWPAIPPTESLIKNATVRVDTRTGDDSWERWDAEATGQVNPQVTDTETEDGIKLPGYYAFYVPSGQYQVHASAPDYADYISPVLTVVDEPVFHNVGMQRISSSATSVPEIEQGEKPQNPTLFTLYQNYPNPFNAGTIIKYYLPQETNVTLTIYDITGREVASLLHNVRKEAGMHSVQYNAPSLASGVYVYKLTAGGYTTSKKFVLMK